MHESARALWLVRAGGATHHAPMRVGTVLLATLGAMSLASVARFDAKARPQVLHVQAAASLAAPFTELARLFERRRPGVHVRLNSAGSQQLVAQIEQGARADVLATADLQWMQRASERGLLASPPVIFAHNRLALIVPRRNLARIERLSDLARPGVKLVLGAPSVPVGGYARSFLARCTRDSSLGTAFERSVLANVVSEEENVKAVFGKVQLGEADAGIVYRSDLSGASSRHVREIAIPSHLNVTASFPIAILARGGSSGAAQAFLDLLRSAEGRAVLERHGLQPAVDAGTGSAR